MNILILPDVPHWIVNRCCDALVANLPHLGFTKRFYASETTETLVALAREHELVYYSNFGDCERHVPALVATGTPVLMSVRSHRYPPAVKQIAKQVAAVHVVNPALAKEFPGSHYIRDGIGDQFFCKPRVGFVGMPDEYKGYQLAEKACKKLGCTFIAATGHINPEDMPIFYRKADIIVCASVAEGFSTVVMEALAMGKLVVSTAMGEPYFWEGLTEGRVRFLPTEDRNTEAIAEAIEELWQGRFARYRWSSLAHEYEALFAKVAATRAVAT